MPRPQLRFDTSEVADLADVLEHAAGAAPAEARKVVAKGALNIKNGARRRVTGHRHLPRYPNAITYDSHQTPTGGWAEIGPDKDRPQGPLGNIIEYGGVREAPIPHMLPAAAEELPRFERAMMDLAERPLR